MNLKQGFFSREFFREFSGIAVPITLTNLMMSSLHIVDNIMVGSLGDLELASVAQANQLSFVLRLTLFGISGACSVFAAQHWGNEEDVPGVKRAMGISLITALGLCLLFTLAATVFPAAVMGIYTPDASAIALGSGYLRIVGPSYLIIAISTIYNAANRSTERVRINLVSSGAAILINVFLNWCLIFGNLGFPRMEVNGAALATAIAAVMEGVILVGWTYIKKYPTAARIKEMLPGSWAYVKRFYRIAIPVTCNECIWALGTSAYSAIYGRISLAAVAAMTVFNTVDQVLMAAVRGIMNATSVMVGKRIGAGKKDDAMTCSRRMMGACLAITVVLGVALVLLRDPIIGAFNISDEAKALAREVLLIAAVVLWIRSVNSINIVGVLRAGGDAIFSLIMDGGSIWLIGVPLAAVSVFVLELPLHYAYLIIQTEEVVKLLLGYWRFRSGKWINNLTV